MSIPESAQLSLLEGLGANLIQRAADAAWGPGHLEVSVDRSGLRAGVKLDTGQTVLIEEATVVSGKVSGRLSVDFQGGDPNSPLSLTLFETFKLSLEEFSVTLKNNAITASSISGTLAFPAFWNHDSNSTAVVRATNAQIGPGGFSGTLGLAGGQGALISFKFGSKFALSLNAFSLTFFHNAITDSTIKGRLDIPGFEDGAGLPAVIDIDVAIHEDGDFKIAASSQNGIPLKIPKVLDFRIYTADLGREDNHFFLSISGTVTLTLDIPALTFDRPIAVDLKKFIIWDDGRFEIQGGTIILPQALTLKIGPVKLSVTAISLGSYEHNNRPYKYFGFDGGVNVNPGGVDVRASGVKVYWSTDSDPLDVFVRVEGIGIDFIIPGSKSAADATVLISGFLQVKEPDTSVAGSSAGREYAGGVKFLLPKAGIGGSAAMRLNPSVPNFIIDTELSISVPIPLGNTSLGIYGFRGLIGFRYVADRSYAPLALPPDAEWYQYYKKKVPLTYKEGVNIDKFAPRKGFAIGAGLTLGTVTDSGKAFSAKLFLLLSLPDALLLQGQAAIMAERVDLSPNDPPFFALIAVTKQSVEAAFGVNYKLPEDSGAILDLQALIEMGFYFNDRSAWYINVGRDLPETKRVTARLFTLFNAWSYLMLSGSGIRAGAGVTWDFQKGFGPVQIGAHAYLDTQGRISFKPKQIGAAIRLGGSASIRVFKFKLGLSIAAALAAEAPKPFIVTGSVDVTLDLPRPFKKLGGTFTLDFTWTFNSALNTEPQALFNGTDVSEAAKAVSLVTRERFDLNVLPAGFSANPIPPPPSSSNWRDNFDAYVVPLDSQIDIEFKKPIAPGPAVTNIGITGTGYVNGELVPPQRGKSPQVQHKYVVEEVKIRSWNPATSQWNDYDIYDALTPLGHASFITPASLIGLKQGWWQLDQPGKVNKLALLAQTPLSYTNDIAGPFVPENSGITTETIFCPATPISEKCVFFDELTELKTLTAGRRHELKGIQARVIGNDGQIIPFLNRFNSTNGLALKAGSRLELFFPEPTSTVKLALTTLADDVTVLYQRRRQTGTNSSRQPVFSYVTVRKEVLDAGNLLSPVKYEATDSAIDKVVVIAGACECLEGFTAPTSGPKERGPSAKEMDAPRDSPLCGSVGAYLANICLEAEQQLKDAQDHYQHLLAQAHEYELLAKQFEGNRCDATLPMRYQDIVKTLLGEAAELKTEITSLEEFVRCCRRAPREIERPRLSPTRQDEVSRRDRFDCNLDPRLDYNCLSFVFSFCWLSLQDRVFNSTIPTFPTLLSNNNAMVTAINKTIHPIWRPDTIYSISLRTVDTVSVPENPGASGTGATITHLHLGFRTKGPLGHFHSYRAEYHALEAQDRTDQYRLQSLKPYIDFAKSYPDAQGNVLGSKPLFYLTPKLKLFYIHPQIYTMYGGQFDAYNGNPVLASSIEVTILDPTDPMPATPAEPSFVPAVTHVFIPNDLGHSNLDIQLLSNMASQGRPCTMPPAAVSPIGIQSEITVDALKPLKLYHTVLKANYNGSKEEVHRYNFQTSRYPSFAAQVNSYKLVDAEGAYLKDAVFDDLPATLDIPRRTQLAALLAGNVSSGDPLEQQYAEPFDRLIDGILQLGPLAPATGTGFNIVRDGSGGAVLGILVCNPEPFNDPKIPTPEISASIVLTQSNQTPMVFPVIHSKDRSKAFIGDPNLNLGLHDLEFTFTYFESNGISYIPAAVVKVDLFSTPEEVSAIGFASIAETG